MTTIQPLHTAGGSGHGSHAGPSTSTTGSGIMVGGRSPALTALAASVVRSPLLSSRSPPLRATAPEFQPSDFNLSSSPPQAQQAVASPTDEDPKVVTVAVTSSLHFSFQ
jgi:hypothetical protein